MSDATWSPPAGAMRPTNHFHTLYMRLTLIIDNLMREAGGHPEFLKNPVFGELVGSCHEISNAAGRLTSRLEGIRRDFPDLWEAWQQAVAHEPTPEELKRG